MSAQMFFYPFSSILPFFSPPDTSRFSPLSLFLFLFPFPLLYFYDACIEEIGVEIVELLDSFLFLGFLFHMVRTIRNTTHVFFITLDDKFFHREYLPGWIGLYQNIFSWILLYIFIFVPIQRWLGTTTFLLKMVFNALPLRQTCLALLWACVVVCVDAMNGKCLNPKPLLSP